MCFLENFPLKVLNGASNTEISDLKALKCWCFDNTTYQMYVQYCNLLMIMLLSSAVLNSVDKPLIYI